MYNVNNAHNYEFIGSSVPEFNEKHKIDKISLREQKFVQEKIGIAFLLYPVLWWSFWGFSSFL